MNPDLQRERDRATFSANNVTYLLDGGSRDRTLRRRQLEAIICNDPTGIFSNNDNLFLHRTDRHVRALAKHVRLVELCRTLGIGSEELPSSSSSSISHGEILHSPDFPILLAAIADDLPTSLHWVMFVPNIISLCDEEQKAAWLPMCRDWRMIGCYAQTELGHGSNVRALETTATFLPEAKGGKHKGGSWIIHSPTLTSAKFWPGTLGRTANHAMVIANLIDGDGVHRGVHNFLVPLRCMHTHKLLPGVTTGDIGPKIGYNVMDNGYARFDRVEIPRRHMAMRFATVDELGKYSKTKHVSDAASKIAYITMMQVRAHICVEAGKNLAMACTIVTRYSAVRRQGFKTKTSDADDDSTERQILDYTQQQHRILPLIAASYCFFFTGKLIQSRLADIESRLVSSSSSSGKNSTVTKPEVADIHASTSGLKSYMTTIAANGIEDCRKACGGHGFLQCSGLPELLTTYLQSPTVEGDNHMLPQQVVKVLLKIVQAVQQQQKGTGQPDLMDFVMCDSYHLVPSLQSIIHTSARGAGCDKNGEKCPASCEEDMQDLVTLCCAFRHVAARLLVECASRMQTAIMNNGKTPDDAWNDALVQMSRVSRAYSQFLLLHNFCHCINQEERDAKSCIGVAEVAVFRDLARLLALYWIESEIGDFLQDGYLSAQQADWVRALVLHMLNVVRHNAVALVDARDFSDFRLKSALGRYDGNVYPAIMEAARRDPLNQTEPGPGYEEHLKRLIVGGVGVYTGTSSRL